MKGGTDTGGDVCQAGMKACRQRVKRRNCKQDDKSDGREQREKEIKTDGETEKIIGQKRDRKRETYFSFVYVYLFSLTADL